MKKVVINTCYGGFGLSHEGVLRYCEIKGIAVYPVKDTWLWTYWLTPESERPETIPREKWASTSIAERIAHNKLYSEQTLHDSEIERDDPALVQVVEEMGEKANGDCAKLAVIEIPDDVKWQIEEYDGMEHVAEVHRTWG